MKNNKEEKTKKQKMIVSSTITFLTTLFIYVIIQITMIIVCIFVSVDWLYRLWDGLTYTMAVLILSSFIWWVYSMFMKEE